jgi:hypothetical protein
MFETEKKRRKLKLQFQINSWEKPISVLKQKWKIWKKI